MRLAKLFFLLVLPALIWNAPLQSSASTTVQQYSPWALLATSNLSYDNLLSFIETIEHGDPSLIESFWNVDDVNDFIAFLSRQGIPDSNTQDLEDLEDDIDWLLSDEDYDPYDDHWFYTSLNDQNPNIILAPLKYPQPQTLLCKSWTEKKWKKTKKFVRKHKKEIIIAAVVVVATVVIVATKGAAAPVVIPAIASTTDRTPVNKPGEVYTQDEEDDPPPRPQPPPLPEPPTHPNPEAQISNDTLKEQTNHIKEVLTQEIPDQSLNIPPKEESTFWREMSDTLSMLSHQAIEDPTNILGIPIKQSSLDTCHENIDDFFGTDYADLFTADAKENQPDITVGVLPPPSTLGETAKKVATLARTSKTLAGTAAAASALSKPTNNFIQQYQSGELEIRNDLANRGFNTPHRPEGIPKDWNVKPSTKGGGIRYSLEIPKKSGDITIKAEVRIMPANPASPQASRRVDYVIHNVNGKYYDKNGNEVDLQSSESHIPLEEYDFNKISKKVPYE